VILKYLEEDMVLSLNVRSLVLQSANEAWQPAFAGKILNFIIITVKYKLLFTEMTPAQLILRKLVTLHDLTVCLDRRNSSGKIEFYEVTFCSTLLNSFSYNHKNVGTASISLLDGHPNQPHLPKYSSQPSQRNKI
jgi:vacuolar protein sorting-associated protein 13B